MNRLDVIQKIINFKKARTYLEIGIEGGDVFLRVKAGRKTAVDPKILISKGSKLRACLRDISNLFNKYYELTSDEFFSTRGNLLRIPMDVVFVDGLHTYEQSLKDVQNSLEILEEDGVIIVHDCNPQNETSAYPAKSWEHAADKGLDGWTGEWSGDVWKTIALLRSVEKKLNIFVLDCDCGLGIITKGTPEGMLTHSKEEIDTFSYRDLERNRAQILNLKSPEYLNRFFPESNL